ncbi:hypothetical protein, partial [Hylemonella gracilis]|uniref:hypothetical protein n=1 Tax=Hylemonella gracilis TaxID=80880 RepID=UPI001110457A
MIHSDTGLLNQGLVDGVSVALESQTVDNQGKLQVRHTADVAVAGAFSNSGTLQADGDMSLTAANIVNTSTGAIAAKGAVIHSDTGLLNQGSVDGTNVLIRAQSLDNQGRLQALNSLDLVTPGAVTNSGTLQSGGGLNLAAANIVNTSTGAIAAKDAVIHSDTGLLNQG